MLPISAIMVPLDVSPLTLILSPQGSGKFEIIGLGTTFLIEAKLL